MSKKTFRAEALAVCGIFVMLTLLYYLTTSKAPDPTKIFGGVTVGGGKLWADWDTHIYIYTLDVQDQTKNGI